MDATLRSQSFLPAPSSRAAARRDPLAAQSRLSSDVSEVLEARKFYLRTPARSIIALAAAGGLPAGKTVLFTIGHLVP